MDNAALVIDSPTLFIDEAKCKYNIHNMWTKAQSSGVKFRPHFKTHQSIEVGKWFIEKGVDGISVSSMDMANYFAGGGHDDITVCIPVNILEIEKINRLAKKIKLNCLIESQEAARFLTRRLEAEVGVIIEIDCGYRRTGVSGRDLLALNEILSILEPCEKTIFKGFLTHSGHSYHAESVGEIEMIHKDTMDKMAVLKSRFKAKYKELCISIGDTPCCSVASDFTGMDEMRPGNFVFYDLTQVQLGVCKPSDVAVALACPVIARYPFRGEVVVHGGGVHLGKESLVAEDGLVSFGGVVEFNDKGWCEPLPGVRVRSLSQEHGIIEGPTSFAHRIHIGDVLGILPVHSCITADAAGGYMTLDGKVLDHMKGRGPCRGESVYSPSNLAD